MFFSIVSKALLISNTSGLISYLQDVIAFSVGDLKVNTSFVALLPGRYAHHEAGSILSHTFSVIRLMTQMARIFLNVERSTTILKFCGGPFACLFSVKVLKDQILVPVDIFQFLLLYLICVQYVDDMMEHI